MFGRATIHPRLVQDPSYDGFHPKESEREHLVQNLPGKPLHFEHIDEHVVGKIVSAFPTSDGDGIDVLFETDNTTFKDMLSNDMLENGLLKDVSMTIKAYKGENADGIPFIAYKDITEVSLVEKGDIPGSHIHWTIPKVEHSKNTSDKKSYIGTNKLENTNTLDSEPLQKNKMSDQSTTSEPSTSNPVMNVQEQLAEQMRSMAEKLAASEAENKRLNVEKETLSVKNAKLSESQKKEREDLVNNHVKKLFSRVMTKFDKQIAPYAEQIEQFQDSMIKNENAMGLTHVLASASTMMDDAFSKQEEMFQNEKAMKEKYVASEKKYESERIEMQKKQEELLRTIRNMSGGSFMEVNERFQNNPATDSMKNLFTAPVAEKEPDETTAILARASKYFVPQQNVVDDILNNCEEYREAKRFRRNDYMHLDNAHIYAKMDELRGAKINVKDFF